MAVYESMQELIGNTPLVRLTKLGLPADARLYAKLETYNPAGSVKDRVGKYMIDAAERDGLLRPGGTIIEATAGNTGLGEHRARDRLCRAGPGLPGDFRCAHQILTGKADADACPRRGDPQYAA